MVIFCIRATNHTRRIRVYVEKLHNILSVSHIRRIKTRRLFSRVAIPLQCERVRKLYYHYVERRSSILHCRAGGKKLDFDVFRRRKKNTLR